MPLSAGIVIGLAVAAVGGAMLARGKRGRVALALVVLGLALAGVTAAVVLLAASSRM